MYSVTKRIPKLATLALIALVAACSSDSSTSPAVSVDPAVNVMEPDAPSVVRQQATVVPQVERSSSLGHATFLNTTGTTYTFQFTVDPRVSQSFTFGDHLLKFPAYTICNPSTSGYGSSTWLRSCTKLTTPITIVATAWTDALGNPRIDFNVDIRFYPNSSGQLPAVYLMDPAASLNYFSRIDYCWNPSSTTCTNEAATDPTLRTQRDPISGYVYRIIRHFSGYNVWA